jgi:serine/threonine-protein kinase
MKTLFVIALVACIGFTSGRAAASDVDATALAETLFQEGLKRMDAGETHQACEKFEQSNRVQSSLGTMYYLADCYEQEGRTASAWAVFVDVAQRARAQGQDAKAQKARDRADSLEKRLVHLTIIVDAPATDGLKIVRSSESTGAVHVMSEAFGVALPIDPGAYTLRAVAPGKKPFDLPVIVQLGDVSVHVPALVADADLAPKTPMPPTANAREQRSIWHSTVKWVGYSVGGAGLLASGVFAVGAKSTFDSTKGACTTNGGTMLCPQSAIDRQKQAGAFADFATASLILGAVGLAFGAGIDLFVPHVEVRATFGLASVSLAVNF